MPCYTPWYSYLEPESEEYKRAHREVTAQLHAVKHIIDYYYRVAELQLPVLPRHVEIDATRQPRSRHESRIREMICHHFACDGIHFVMLYDACSLLDENDSEDRPYLAVIAPCAFLMRSDTDRFRPAR